MIIRNSVVIVYDIEIFPNVFHCTCKDTETNKLYFFEISNRKNQLTELVDFFFYKNIGDKMFCGYNNKHYDDVIINYLIDFYYKMDSLSYLKICNSLFNLSSTIVTSEEGDTSKFKRWKYAKYFYSMDLLTMLFSSKLRVGLKEMQVTMHYKNVEEYSGDFSQFLPDSEIDNMIEYNINDVESTTELLNRLKDDVQLRLFIEKEYGIDALSMDSVKFGETLLLKKYCEETRLSEQYVKTLRSPMDYIPLKDVILPFISYKNPKLQDVLKDMKSQIVYSKERKGYEKKFVLSNVRYSVGVGGIHSLHTPQIFVPSDNEYIGHSDVALIHWRNENKSNCWNTLRALTTKGNNVKDWAISSKASFRGMFTDYPAREYDASDKCIGNGLILFNMIQRLEDKFKAGIYVIQNNVNSKKYVGKSVNIYKRIMAHVTNLNTRNKNENRHLINAWHKYGRSNFSYYVIEYVYEENEDKLNEILAERELYWITTLKTIDRNCGYNMRLDSSGKCIVLDETRQKLREANIKRFSDPKEREKIGMMSYKAHKEHPEYFADSFRKVAIARRKFRIAKCDKENNILKIYDVIGDILEENPTFYKQAIKGCCQGTKSSYKGFNWHYCKLDFDELVIK